MGLDMYLRAKYYVWSKTKVKVSGPPDLMEGITTASQNPNNEHRTSKVRDISVEIGYWRKANAIHNWFVEFCQEGRDECNETHVPREKLQQLLKVCEEVLKLKPKGRRKLSAEGIKAIEVLLPTTSGFFFGSTEYDTSYWMDIEETIKTLNRALSMPESWDFYYQSSW